MKSCCIADHHHQFGRRRKKSPFTTSILTFVCILSSIIVLISSKIGTSNDQNHITTSADKSIAGNHNDRTVLRRGSGTSSKVFQLQSSAHFTTALNNYHNHCKLQASERCITITIFLDQYPADTTWIITNSSSGDTVATSPIYDDSVDSTEQTQST